MQVKSFNSINGFSVGENPYDVISNTGNITGNSITSTGLITTTGNITGNYFIGNGSQLINITGANVTGNVTSATTAYNANVSLVSNNQEYRPLLATNTAGNLALRASAGISWNPSTYGLTAGKILLGSGIGAQGITGAYAYGANTAWQVQSQNGTGTDALGQEIGRIGSEFTSGPTTFWDSYISYYQGSGSNSGWLNINAAGNSVANVTGTGISVTGTLTATGNISGNTNGFTIGYLNLPQVVASNVTLSLTDAGKHYYANTVGNLVLTVPNNATTAFATGTTVAIIAQATGNVLVNAGVGVTMYMAGNSTSANRVVSTYGMASLVKVATNTWFINGTGVS
jgi:hypothetical protein